MSVWLLVPAAYVIGSIPWGLLAVYAVRRVDVRSLGSGSTGATNVLRTVGKPLAAIVLLADVAKGVIPVLVARALTEDPAVSAAVAGAVIVGHIWPVFARFRGGRGIAAGVGAAGALDPLAGAVGLGVFLPVVGATRYVSLGSVLSVAGVATFFAVRYAMGLSPLAYLVFAVAVGVLIQWKHRQNIARLVQGTEHRLGERSLP